MENLRRVKENEETTKKGSSSHIAAFLAGALSIHAISGGSHDHLYDYTDGAPDSYGESTPQEAIRAIDDLSSGLDGKLLIDPEYLAQIKAAVDVYVAERTTKRHSVDNGSKEGQALYELWSAASRQPNANPLVVGLLLKELSDRASAVKIPN
jgi:hypothetical protein